MLNLAAENLFIALFAPAVVAFGFCVGFLLACSAIALREALKNRVQFATVLAVVGLVLLFGLVLKLRWEALRESFRF